MPSFTFVSTANAFVLRGARPVFADIRPDTLNLDERLLAAIITPRTRAIVPVHYAGVGCEMDAILAVARQHGLAVVEDNAHGLFGAYRGRPLGSLGGAGGPELPRDEEHQLRRGRCAPHQRRALRRARRDPPREGHEPEPLLPGPGGQVHLGGRGLERAAVRHPGGVPLRPARGPRQRSRRSAAGSGSATRGSSRRGPRGLGIRLPSVPAHCEQPYHLFFLDHRVARPAHARSSRICKQRGILAVFHYLPLHLSEMGQRLGGQAGRLPGDRGSERSRCSACPSTTTSARRSRPT